MNDRIDISAQLVRIPYSNLVNVANRAYFGSRTEIERELLKLQTSGKIGVHERMIANNLAENAIALRDSISLLEALYAVRERQELEITNVPYGIAKDC